MTIQALQLDSAQGISERYYPTPEVQSNAKNAVTDADQAPGITAIQGKSSGAGENGIRGELQDRFTPREPAYNVGLYRKVRNRDGKATLQFDDPAKNSEEKDAVKAAEEEKAAKEEKAAEENKQEKAEAKTKTTTINTDRVDREIEKLQEEVQDVTRQLRTATGEQAEKLKQELLLDKIQLRLKDNDTYRRAHSVVRMELE